MGTSLSLFCRANAVPAATFVEIRRRNATDEIVLNRTDLDDSNMQFVQYTLSDLMLSDSSDVFSCVANNSVGLREQNFTLVVQGGWTFYRFCDFITGLGRKPVAMSIAVGSC